MVFLDLKSITFSKSYLNKIKQIQITNRYNQKESYRAYLVDIDPDDYIDGVKYAVIMTNISQLEQTSEKHESPNRLGHDLLLGHFSLCKYLSC